MIISYALKFDLNIINTFTRWLNIY